MTNNTRSRYDSILRHLILWWKDNRRDFPWRDPDLSPFEILIAEVMLQKTRAIKVARVFPEFVHRYPDPSTLSKASEEEIFNAIYHLGLNKRAKELKDLSGRIMTKFEGTVPEDREDLLSMPGVGDYTASAVRDFAMGKLDSIVDANTKRIATRVWDIDEKEVKSKLRKLITKNARDGYYMLFDFGAAVCKAPRPTGGICPINTFCAYHHKKKAQLFKGNRSNYQWWLRSCQK